MKCKFLLLLACHLPTAAWAATLAGEWSYRALNSGDTNFKAEQQGDEVTFYRVLWPEFEGQRYKLEHIYRGTIKGDTISGRLYVREDGRGEFEPLRPFTGRVLGPDRLELDDLPLRREGAAAEPSPPAQPYARVVINRPAAEAPPATPTCAAQEEKTPVASPAAGTAQAAPPLPDLSQLLRVSRAVPAEADRLLEQADADFAARRYEKALALYQKIEKLEPQRVELLYKLGWCHGTLGVLAFRKGLKTQAASNYRQAIHYWKQAVRFDPYNSGAIENIRRAEERLAQLGG